VRKELFLVFFLLLLPLGLSSTPDFGIETSFDDEVVNGNNTIGSLVLTTRPYIPDTYNFSSFDNFSAQQHDIVVWQGNETIRVTPPFGNDIFLINNSELYIDNVGDYHFVSLQNQSKLGTMQIVSRDFNTIEIERLSTPSGIDLSFSKSSFELVNEEVVSVYVHVDEDVNTGVYDLSYKVNDRVREFEVEVMKNLDWEIAETNITEEINISSGQNLYIGYLILENTGNDDVTISTNKYGDYRHLVIIPQPQKLFKKSTLRLEFSVQVPTTQGPTTAVVPINISGGDKNEVGNLTLYIKDSIKPVIESINFSNERAQTENNISIIATDNNNVSNVTLEYDDKIIVFDKNNQLFTQTIVFDKLSRYLLTFCAFDNDDNKECVLMNKTFTQLDLIVDLENTIKMPSKKVSQYSKIKLFNLTEDVKEGVFLTLDSFEALTTTEFDDSYTIRVVDGDGSIKTFRSFEQEIMVSKKGEVFLEIRSNEVADYTGIISITPPEYASQVSDIKFDVSFKDYDVPNDFVRPWTHDSEVDCKVVDTGDLGNTRYECTFDAPIDIRPDDISIPTTISERQEFENKANVVSEELKTTKKRSAVIITFLAVLLLIIGLLSYYMIYHYPYVRISTGHDLKYKYNKQGDKEYGE